MAFDMIFLIVGYDSLAKHLLFVSFLDYFTNVLITNVATQNSVAFYMFLKDRYTELWLFKHFNTIHIHWFLNSWIEYLVILIFLSVMNEERDNFICLWIYFEYYCHSNYVLNKILAHLMQSCAIMNFIIMILNDVCASRMIKMAHCFRS